MKRLVQQYQNLLSLIHSLKQENSNNSNGDLLKASEWVEILYLRIANVLDLWKLQLANPQIIKMNEST